MIVSLLLLNVSLISITAGDEPNIGVYLSTDEPYYTYGQSGKIFVTLRNEGPGPIEIRNITIMFSWHGWYHGGWEGNSTITDIEDNTVAENATSETFEVEFTVPQEGRVGLGLVSSAWVTVTYVWGDEPPKFEWEEIGLPVEMPVTQSEALTPILYLTAGITVLLILALAVLYFVWLSLRRLTPTPPAAATA